MSQEDWSRMRSPLPGPPPPPSTAFAEHPQLSPSRPFPVQPPRLRTAIAPAHQGAHVSYTPASAVNLSVPHSPFIASSPSTHASSPAMRNTSVPYNPQQWSRSNGPMGGQYAPHTAVQTAARTHDMTGMEGNSRPFLNFQMLCSVSRYSGSQSTSYSSHCLFVLLWGITKQS
jgi:hypothetical protein